MNREWAHEVDQQLRQLQQRTAHLPTRVRGGGSGGGGIDHAGVIDVIWVVADAKANLPDADDYEITKLARIEGAGTDNGMVCVVDPAGTGWNAINFWE